MKPSAAEFRLFVLDVAEWARDEMQHNESAYTKRQRRKIQEFRQRAFDLLGDPSVADANRIREKATAKADAYEDELRAMKRRGVVFDDDF